MSLATRIAEELNAIRYEVESKLAEKMTEDILTSTSTVNALSANQGRVLKELIDSINVVLTSDDTTLDELQEVVDFIKQNKSDLEALNVGSIAGLQTALDGKVDDSQVLTNVPSGAVFTDTVYTHPSTHPASMITTTDEFSLSNSTNVPDVLDDFDQAIINVAAKDPKLTLTGDVTGSATFTNLGNATLIATVASDSHIHDGRYYTEDESDARFLGISAKASDSDRLDGQDGSYYSSAANIASNPQGNLSSTDVQSALEELQAKIDSLTDTIEW